MKTLLLLLTPLISLGQLALTPIGLRDSVNQDKSYIVIECPGKTAKELYDNGLRYINKVYKNPKLITKGDIAGDYLRFEVYAPDVSSFSFMVSNLLVSLKYSVELSFKDGKVKYEISDLDLSVATRSDVNKTHGGPMDITGNNMNRYAIYKESNLKLIRPDVKADIERYFNNQISKTKPYLQSLVKDDW